MDNFEELSQPVDVVAVYRADSTYHGCMPVKMKYRGREIVFTELGLRHPTSRGKRMLHIFDMSDGSNDYRLEFDAEGLVWTLRAIGEGGQL